MTGIIINSNEYQVNTGSTKIEYASSGDCVGYSMWGEDIPYNDVWKSITRQQLFTEFPDIYRNGYSAGDKYPPGHPKAGQTIPSGYWGGEKYRHKVENLLKNGSGGGSGDKNYTTFTLTFNLTKPVKLTYISLYCSRSAGGISFTVSGDGTEIFHRYWYDKVSTESWSGEVITKNTLTFSLYCEYLRGGNLSNLNLTMFTKK